MTSVSFRRKKRFKPQQAKRDTSPAKVDVSKYTNKGVPATEPPAYQNQYSFDDFPIDAKLRKLIHEKGYKTPSEIQDKAIMPALNGKDIIGIAGTGTGKTAAFLIPVIQQLLENGEDNYALILAPTRELANQIQDEFKSLTRGLNLFSSCLIGGTSVSQCLKSLRRKNHVIIATPGRLQDMANQGAINYRDFSVLILDEFDRMLDMGFAKEVQRVNRAMTNKEQTLLLSATLDKSQQRLIDEVTDRALMVQSERSTHRSNAINQEVIRTEGKDKFALLKDLLDQPEQDKTILFCETKRHADRMVKKLTKSDFKAGAIHGDKSQNQRERTLNQFKQGQINILVATDVVARGIDISDVEMVINYKEPKNYADYVHRIGRTGRAGKMGRAVTFID